MIWHASVPAWHVGGCQPGWASWLRHPPPPAAASGSGRGVSGGAAHLWEPLPPPAPRAGAWGGGGPGSAGAPRPSPPARPSLGGAVAAAFAPPRAAIMRRGFDLYHRSHPRYSSRQRDSPLPISDHGTQQQNQQLYGVSGGIPDGMAWQGDHLERT